MRLRRRDDSWENPAWPGLVDLFAFGMVIMLTLWVGASVLRPDGTSVRQQLAEAMAEVERLTREVKEREREIDRLQQQLGGEKGGIDKLLRAMLEEEIRAIRLDLESAVGPTGADDPLDRIVIKEFEGQPVRFATGQAELSPEDTERLRSFTTKLSRVISGHAAAKVLINGTADPRPMTQPHHPKDNTELSALRAAAVARVLTESGGLNAKRLQVTGLGEEGKTAPPGLRGPALDEHYGQYRTVTLEIRVDVQVLAASRNGSDRG